MSYYDELDSFMQAVRQSNGVLTGEPESYQKVTGRAGNVNLLGPYMIRADEWETLTAEAGLEGAPWQDKYAQEAVVRFQFTRLYNEFEGKWDGVAVAWKAGEQAARYIVTDGHPITAVIGGDGASELQMFINDTMTDSQGDDVALASAEQGKEMGPFANAGLVAPPRPAGTRQQMSPETAVQEMLTSMRDNQAARMPEPEEEPVDEGGVVDNGNLA